MIGGNFGHEKGRHCCRPFLKAGRSLVVVLGVKQVVAGVVALVLVVRLGFAYADDSTGIGRLHVDCCLVRADAESGADIRETGREGGCQFCTVPLDTIGATVVGVEVPTGVVRRLRNEPRVGLTCGNSVTFRLSDVCIGDNGRLAARRELNFRQFSVVDRSANSIANVPDKDFLD